MLCCQTADEETIATEPELFDCDACPIREATEALYSENAEAWEIFQRIYTRFAVDMGIVPDILRALTAGWSGDERAELFDRLEIVYELLYPPAPRPTN